MQANEACMSSGRDESESKLCGLDVLRNYSWFATVALLYSHHDHHEPAFDTALRDRHRRVCGYQVSYSDIDNTS